MICPRCKRELKVIKKGWQKCPKCGLPSFIPGGKKKKAKKVEEKVEENTD